MNQEVQVRAMVERISQPPGLTCVERWERKVAGESTCSITSKRVTMSNWEGWEEDGREEERVSMVVFM